MTDNNDSMEEVKHNLFAQNHIEEQSKEHS